MRAERQPTVIAEEPEILGIVDGQLAPGAGQPTAAAGHGPEDVVGVHGPEDEARSVPWGQAPAAQEASARPVEAAKADGIEVDHAPLEDDGHGVLRVATGGQEEGPIDEREFIVDREGGGAGGAVDLADPVPREVRQKEAADLVVAVGSVVLHLDVVGVEDGLRKDAERRQVRAVAEDVTGSRCRCCRRRL